MAAQLEGVCAQGGAPLSALQTHFIQNMIHDTLEEFRYWSYWPTCCLSSSFTGQS